MKIDEYGVKFYIIDSPHGPGSHWSRLTITSHLRRFYFEDFFLLAKFLDAQNLNYVKKSAYLSINGEVGVGFSISYSKKSKVMKMHDMVHLYLSAQKDPRIYALLKEQLPKFIKTAESKKIAPTNASLRFK